MSNYKHGCTKLKKRNKNNPEWKANYIWLSMRARCFNQNRKDYKNYGGRGITVCDRWLGKNGFQNFLEDMGLPPKGTTLDRIENSENYCKENCRWATRKQQNRNKRNNRYLEYNGKRMMLCEWADYLGVKGRLLSVRLNRGWSVEKTLSTPKMINGSAGVLTVA